MISCNRCPPDADCFNSLKTQGVLNHVQGWVTKLDQAGLFIILVPGKYGQRAFLPCNIPKKFQVNHLGVVVSGWIKSNLSDEISYPYHPQPLVITSLYPTGSIPEISLKRTQPH